MVKKGSSHFSASSIARSGVVLSRSVEISFALEAEVSRLRHHVSVLSHRLHFCENERDSLQESAVGSPRSDSPFTGVDSDSPPPPSEVVACAHTPLVVRLPSLGGEAGDLVAASAPVAASMASSVVSSGMLVLSYSNGKLGNVRRKRRSPKRGSVIGEVDDDDDLIMGSAEPRSEIYRQNVLCRDREAERDRLDTPPPGSLGILAPGRDSEFVWWGVRRLQLEEGPLAVSVHMCPVRFGGVKGIIVRCQCRAEFERKRLGTHLQGVLRKGVRVEECPEGRVIKEGGRFVAARDVDLNCLVEGCPVGGASFTGMARALIGS
ncbi:hypothetical protein B9Z19DRAFT_1134043 [Tuber borchii]|uniref:Uncharacterized protein n=1 Tax=Tuber borchii TaxID=42251 RepID=A0A2T6ZER0_TUBBO|nr:hypothetical protein B9Z19DRAFT_1134043 [Tuber borchii]